MSNICNLPKEVLTDVLVRLPTKMDSRLRCVSKSWRTLIGSPEFRHVRSSAIKSLIFLSEKNHLYMAKCMDSPEKMIPDSKIETERENKDEIMDIIGSCNGMLCLSFYVPEILYVVVVMNPRTKQSVELPPVEFKYGYCMRLIGFGYDNVNDDYKVVRLSCDDDQKLDEVQVYSFRSKCWRDLERHDSCNWIGVASNKGVFTNGALHWIVIDRDAQKYAIVAFDLADEKFCRFSLPSEANDAFGSSFARYFGEVDGCLSLFLRKHQNGIECDVWMMKEYGVPDSWTKLSMRPSLNLFLDRENLQLGSSSRKNLLRCNFDARSVLKPRILNSYDYLVFRNRGNKLDDDLILWNPKEWKAVFTFTPNPVKLPAQN